MFLQEHMNPIHQLGIFWGLNLLTCYRLHPFPRFVVEIEGWFWSRRHGEGTKMSPKSSNAKTPAEQVFRDICSVTRRHFSAEDEIEVVPDGLRGEDSMSCCRC